MNGTDDSDDDFIAATQVSYYGPNGWTSQTQGASTSGQPRNHGASSSQRPQSQGTSSQTQKRKNTASQYSQNMASTNQNQNQGTTNHMPQNHGASSQAQKRRTAGRENSQNEATNQATISQRPHGASSQVPQNHEVPTNNDWEKQLVHLANGVTFLQDQIMALSQSDPRKDEKKDKKKKPKESHKCQLCPKVLANATNLTRHYKAIHNEFNLAKFGFTVNDTVLSIDDSISEDHRCGICGYATADKNALDTHTAIVHRNDLNNSRPSVNNDKNNNVEAIKNKMHKCEDCSCYFDDKNKFDEHMKSLHGHEVLCKVCNKNFRFKDFESHVKDNHPDVYNDKDVTVKNNVIVEKNVRAKKGRAIVFKCNKCTEKFACKKEAWRHAKIHKKELRRRDVGNSQAGNSGTNREDINTNNEDILTIGNIIYVCEVCNIATASYDVVVEHSQKHIINPDIQFSTNYCGVCCLKFETICHDKHIDVHYTNKETNKDSFVYLKYKHHLLLTGDWLNFFNMREGIVNRVVSRSIYANTRSIKMRVVSGKTNPNTLYQCRQCDNFVEPSEVRTHAVNFDTCVQIRTSFICSVCERSFSSELARDNHEAVHNDMNHTDSFRIVMFNDDSDREFNHILNNVVSTIDSQVAATNNDENNATEQVIYKCLGCSLCFILKESANNHIKACPSHRQKKICRICNNWFNMHELVDHYYEHHYSGNVRLIINDIVPDVVLISDDESNNEDDKGELKIRSGDGEDGTQNEIINDIVPEVVLISDGESNNEDDKGQLKIRSDDDKDGNKNDITKKSHNAYIILDDDNENKSHTSEIENVTEANPSAEESDIQTNLLVAAYTVKDDEPMVENDQDEHNQSINDEDFDHSDFEVSRDDDSQSTLINGESHNIPNVGDARRNEIKCVETNLLMNPFHVRNRSERIIDADERNYNLAAEIETTRLNIALEEIKVKKENPWFEYGEDTDMNWRHLKQRKSIVTSTDTIIDLSAMLTDDEDEANEFIQVNESADVRVNTNYYTSNPVSSVDGAYNPENIITDIANNSQNVQNGIISNSDTASNLIEERSVNILMNETSRDTAALSERSIVINTDIKVNTKNKTKLPQNEENENGLDDSVIEEIPRTSDDTMRQVRNRMNDANAERLVVNNLQIQLSECNIF